MPAAVHPGPDPAALYLCRDLVAQTDAEAVVLLGSRARGSWDEQSDLDLIIVHDNPDNEERRTAPSGRPWSSSRTATARATGTAKTPITGYRPARCTRRRSITSPAAAP